MQGGPVDVANQAMGGLDLEPLKLGIDEHHHRPVRRECPARRVLQVGVCADLGLVRERRLVPMVPIGDEQLLPRQVPGQMVVGLDRREAVQQAIRVARPPLIGPSTTHQVAVARRAIEVDRQDRRELGVGGIQQAEPIRLWAGHGVLVSPHAASERLEQNARQHARDGGVVGCLTSRVTVVIERRLQATLEGSVRQPGVQGRGCCGVGIRLSGELEADRVPWVPLQERAPLLRADDVEGWRNEVADVGHPTGVLWRLLGKANPVRDPIRAVAVQRVVNATEWPDQGHRASLAAGRISARGAPHHERGRLARSGRLGPKPAQASRHRQPDDEHRPGAGLAVCLHAHRPAVAFDDGTGDV